MPWLGIAGTLITYATALTAIIGSLLAYGANRRAQYERVLAETAKLTTGEVAEARQLIGKIPKEEDRYLRRFDDKEVNALYVVLWQFERLHALYGSLERVVFKRFPTRPQRLLLQSITGSVEIWSEIVGRRPVDRSTGKPANIGPNAKALEAFARELGLRKDSTSESVAGSTQPGRLQGSAGGDGPWRGPPVTGSAEVDAAGLVGREHPGARRSLSGDGE